MPAAVVQPASEEELVALVRWAQEKSIALTPRGRATSGYGGVLPVKGGLVVDFFHLSTILKIDTTTQTARVQPEAAPLQPSEGTIGKPPVTAIPKKGPAARKDKKATGKKSRHELLKMFFASEVAREDAPGAGVSKDVMYETFARWCREKRILPVPDRRSLTVALKNQFALQETVIEGVPSWTGIRLK
jgi:hypothetical protein